MRNPILFALFATSLTSGIAEAKMNSPQNVLEIIGTVNAIGTSADAKDWKKCEAQFADDVFVDYSALTGTPGNTVKAKDLIAGWAKVLGPVQMTQHMITNHEVEIEGDDATVHSYVSAMHSHPAKTGEDYWLLMGKYIHKLHHEKSGWKVVSMKLIPTYQAGNKKLLEQIAK